MRAPILDCSQICSLGLKKMFGTDPASPSPAIIIIITFIEELMHTKRLS